MIGEILRNKRLADGLPIIAISSKTGYSKQYLSEVERGVKNPKTGYAIGLLAEAYGIDKKVLVDEVARQMMEDE